MFKVQATVSTIVNYDYNMFMLQATVIKFFVLFIILGLYVTTVVFELRSSLNVDICVVIPNPTYELCTTILLAWGALARK